MVTVYTGSCLRYGVFFLHLLHSVVLNEVLTGIFILLKTVLKMPLYTYTLQYAPIAS